MDRTQLDTRVIYGIGNGVCNIFAVDGGFEVEVECNAGKATTELKDEAEAWKVWLHPFAWALEIPSSDRRRLVAGISAEGHALLESTEYGEEVEDNVA